MLISAKAFTILNYEVEMCLANLRTFIYCFDPLFNLQIFVFIQKRIGTCYRIGINETHHEIKLVLFILSIDIVDNLLCIKC